MTLLDRALSLTPPEHPDHADVLITWARARSQAGHDREACDALQKAATLHLAAGHPVPAGGALAEAAGMLLNLGDPTARAVLDRAITLLQTEPAGPELVYALTALGFEQSTSGRPTQALATLQRAESLADRNDARLLTRIARVRGETNARLGEPDALTHCERALQRAVDLGEGQSATIGHVNLASYAAGFEGPEAALNRAQQAERFALDRGLRSAANYARLLCPWLLFELGRLDEAATQADAELLIAKEQHDEFAFVHLGTVKAMCLQEFGQPAPHLAEAVLTAARDTGNPDLLVGAAKAAVSSRSADGDRAGTVAVIQEVLATHQPPEPALYATDVHKLVRGAVIAGDSTLARGLIESVDATSTALPATQHGLVTARALVAQANGDHAAAADLFADAAQRWASFGSRLEQAHALLGLGRSLSALGRAADKPLSEARNLFQSMGALPRVRQCDQLLDPTAQVIPPVSDAG